jgi:hypothetical protein
MQHGAVLARLLQILQWNGSLLRPWPFGPKIATNEDRTAILFGVLPRAPEDVEPETFVGQMLHPLRAIRNKRAKGPSEAC